MLLEELGGLLLSSSPNLADHHNSLCAAVLQEHLQTVHKVCSVEWITAYTYNHTNETTIPGFLSGRENNEGIWKLQSCLLNTQNIMSKMKI